MSSIKGKTVLITGGASGIGKLMGEKLLKAGAKQLVIWDINRRNLDKASSELKARGFTVFQHVIDISDTDKVVELVKTVKKETGSVDILINNAGVVAGKKFVNLSHKEIDFTMNVNSLAMMHITLEFLPDMIEKGNAHIINISSAAGYVANPKMSVYAASKWAALGWSESLRIELEELHKNLHVTTVTPFYINTGMFEGVKFNSFLPILDSDKITDVIIEAIKNNKLFVREPLLVKMVPLVKGILPTRVFDWFVGRVLGVYKSMDNFVGHEGKNHGKD
ncbi:MAG: SDR family oxidoreductase [Epsilonproteobacteria bacterium]|nr:SDR family oxidoreductase [Campylobacterota bacterium]